MTKNSSFSSADAEYFASANLNSVEDVASAIECCKTNILETTENTTSRKSTVNRLIQLQIRQEDLKEKQELSAITFETRGHTFANYSHEIKVPGKTFFKCFFPEIKQFKLQHIVEQKRRYARIRRKQLLVSLFKKMKCPGTTIT